MDDEFVREDLEFHLPQKFKGLSKEYILECVFDDRIQKQWRPGVGDLMVGPTGNLFVVSAVERLHRSLGGDMYFFGGGSCNRNGGVVLDDTFCYTANESGRYFHPTEGEKFNPNHSSIRKFRYVPYPHERCGV